MIKTITYIECDCCGTRLEDSPWNEDMAAHHARQHGWHVEHRPARHYCPACKVPAKLARELEAAK